jgi:hypothetical protein
MFFRGNWPSVLQMAVIESAQMLILARDHFADLPSHDLYSSDHSQTPKGYAVSLKLPKNVANPKYGGNNLYPVFLDVFTRLQLKGGHKESLRHFGANKGNYLSTYQYFSARLTR